MNDTPRDSSGSKGSPKSSEGHSLEGRRLDDRHIESLLRIGVARREDEFLERLAEPDAESWLEESFRAHLSAADGGRALVDGSSTDAELEEWCGRCRELGRAPGEPSLFASGAYFLVVAAGLAHRGLRLSKRSDGELRRSLRDLREAAPAPWQSLLDRALGRLTKTHGTRSGEQG